MCCLTARCALVQDALLEVLPGAAAVSGSGSHGGVFIGEPKFDIVDRVVRCRVPIDAPQLAFAHIQPA